MKFSIQGEFINTNIENFTDKKSSNCIKERCNKIDNEEQCLSIVNGVKPCTWDYYSNPNCIENPMLHSMSSKTSCSCTSQNNESDCVSHGCSWNSSTSSCS
tara:strand:+ start:490 stop:792 length:303 start_codon:yes stop_codon:yes gene_type:complete